MVDWSIARTLARLAAGIGDEEEPPFEVTVLCDEMEPHVSGYTGLAPSTPIPAAEAVSRADWASINLDSFAPMLEPVAARIDDRLSFAGPLAGALRMGASATLAAEAGLVMGYMSQRVLGQYEVSLLGGDAPPRLLFVAPNLAKAVRDLEVEPQAFGRWVAAHELTHVLQFQGVDWLRPHMSGLLRRYLATVELRIDHGQAGGLPSIPDPKRLLDSFREGGLAGLVQSDDQRALMDEIQAAMALIEGYSEHVMDVVAERAIAGHEPLREAMSRRRANRSAPARLLERLLGFDLKMRQYRLGKDFADAVVTAEGIEGLNRVWAAPSALPALDELSEPARWLERTRPPQLA